MQIFKTQSIFFFGVCLLILFLQFIVIWLYIYILEFHALYKANEFLLWRQSLFCKQLIRQCNFSLQNLLSSVALIDVFCCTMWRLLQCYMTGSAMLSDSCCYIAFWLLLYFLRCCTALYDNCLLYYVAAYAVKYNDYSLIRCCIKRRQSVAYLFVRI